MSRDSNTLHKVKDDDPRLQSHPMLNEKLNWRERAVPLVVHGDGVRCTMKGNSLLTFQWAFLTAAAWDWDSIFYTAGFPKVCRSFEKVPGVGHDT